MAFHMPGLKQPLLDLEVDKGSDFIAWKDQWESYRIISGLAEQPADIQVHALRMCLSRHTISIVNNLGLTPSQAGDQASIIAALQSHVKGQLNESVERRNFRKRQQAEGESFDDFLVSLRDLAKTCSFCTDECLQKNIRDQLIEGLRDGATVQELLKVRTLSLDAAITACRGMEAAQLGLSDIKGSPSVHKLQNSKPRQPTRSSQQPSNTKASRPVKQSQPKQSADSQSKPCPGCGKASHEGGRPSCPAYKVECHNCHKLGHYKSVCRSKGSEGSVSSLAVNSVNNPVSVSAIDPPCPQVTVQAKSQNGEATVKVLPDSGSNLCCAGVDFLPLVGMKVQDLDQSTCFPKSANGKVMKPYGSLAITFSTGVSSSKEVVHVYPGIRGALLSWKAAVRLGFLPANYPQLQRQPAQLRKVSYSNGVTREDLIAEFPDVFDGQIKVMPGETFKIVLSESATPFCVNAPRTIPFPYKEKLRQELELLQEQGIIAPQKEPTDWCAPIVVTPKKDGDRIRLCVDLSKLNRYVKRERYQSTTPALAVADIAKSKAQFFSVFDAMKGYHQCPLDEKSQLLTTFITPFGRYKYLRAPFGISSISEHYDRRMAEAFDGLSQFRRIVDDTLVYDTDKGQHVERVRQFLQRCKERGISLCKEKFKFCLEAIDFAGFHLSKDGYRLSPDITKAITEFPTPASITDLRSFLGLVNQLAGTSDKIAEVTGPLRPLLSSKNSFIWDQQHETAFQATKSALSTAPIMAFYDATRPTRLLTDASRLGVGFVLQQQQESVWLTVQAGSRFLTDTESRYAVIELEMLAVAWATSKCRVFLAGLPCFEVVTDHNPLVPVLNTHRLDEIENPRLQRLRTRLMAYNFTARWLKGSKHMAADSLSRHPTDHPESADTLGEYDLDVSHTVNSVQALSFSEIRLVQANDSDLNLRLQEVLDHANQDLEYQQLRALVLEGFPSHKSCLPDNMKKFWGIREHLAIDDELIVFGCRLFIPESLRSSILLRLHEGHMGVNRSLARARLTIYWPRMDQDICELVDNCQHCQDRLPSQQQEPLRSKPRPSRPFQEVAADFAQYGGQQFLITVDCYSDWPDIFLMGTDTTASALIRAVRTLFCRTAAPDVFWSDEGTQFMSAPFQKFLQEWGVQHKTSSPRYPQSNGKAEAAVKSMKKLISGAWRGRSLDHERLLRALMQYRNTPCDRDGKSPAQKLYGRPIQDSLPAHRRSFAPEWQKVTEDQEQRNYEESLDKTQSSYDRCAKPLPDLVVGSHVAVQNPVSKLFNIYGTVVNVGPHRRYSVKTSSGRILVRNRRFLRRRTLVSLPAGTALPALPQPPPHSPEPPAAEPRRSTRQRRAPQRLIEEI